MPWTKLKNIILLILVLTNLFLLVLVGGQEIQNRRTREQTRANAILFLQERGIQVDETLIPQEVGLVPQVAQRDLEGEAQAAQALLQGTCQMESRGGEVYRYFNENGRIQFHNDGTFSAQLEPGAFPAEEDRVEQGIALLERIGFQGTLVQEGQDGLIFCQSWEGVPLFNLQVTLEYQDGEVSALSAGRRLVGQPVEDTTRQTITVATALIDFLNGVSALGDVCNRIDAIEEGYVGSASLSGPMTLTPVWRVTTDTGFYQLDMVTGGVSRVS